MISPGNGTMSTQSDTWWIETHKSQITTLLAVTEAIFGLICAISIFSPSCIPAGILQIISAIIVLAIEAPTFVTAIQFAQPVGMFFDGKPVWVKFVTYLIMAIIPTFFGCYGITFMLAFLSAGGIAGLFGVLLLGRKANRDEMRFQASGGGGDPYSPSLP